MIAPNEHLAGRVKKAPGDKLLCHICRDESGHSRSIGLGMRLCALCRSAQTLTLGLRPHHSRATHQIPSYRNHPHP
jgi:hypothetical protein